MSAQGGNVWAWTSLGIHSASAKVACSLALHCPTTPLGKGGLGSIPFVKHRVSGLVVIFAKYILPFHFSQ